MAGPVPGSSLYENSDGRGFCSAALQCSLPGDTLHRVPGYRCCWGVPPGVDSAASAWCFLGCEPQKGSVFMLVSDSVRVRSTVGFLAVLGLTCGAWAFAQAPQGPAQGQGRGGRGGGAQRAATATLVFKVEWVRPASQTEQVAVVPENVGDSSLELKQYGPAAKQLLTSGNPGSPTAPFS